MSNSKQMNILLVLAPLMPTNVPQIGLPYLKAVLKQKGYQVTIDDITPKIAKFSKHLHVNNMSDIEVQKSFFCEHEQYLNNWAESVIESGFNIVGFSLWQSNIYITKQLIKLIRQKKPQVRIICGGPEHNTLFDLLYQILLIRTFSGLRVIRNQASRISVLSYHLLNGLSIPKIGNKYYKRSGTT